MGGLLFNKFQSDIFSVDYTVLLTAPSHPPEEGGLDRNNKEANKISKTNSTPT